VKYTSQRNRLAAVEAQLGPRHHVLRIVGGLPPDAAVSPQAPQPETPHPPRMAGFLDPEPSAE
jgi:hypothetical protein